MVRLRESGATLVELVMTIVIISIAVVGVVGAFATIAGRSADPLNETRAVELAQLYLDEILAKKYDEDTPDGGVPPYAGACNIGNEDEARGAYDDVDDYHGLDESPATLLGSSAGYNQFNVVVTVTCAGDQLLLASAEAKRVDLTITIPGGQDFQFTAYRVNY